jgi:oligopeptide transport system permease protein
MSAILENPPAAELRDSPGLWALAWRRLRHDRVGMVSLAIVVFFLALMTASYLGLVAADWGKEKGVSYANPSFLAGSENLEAQSMARKGAAAKAPPVDLSDVDPLAPRYKEWDERAAKIAVTEVKRSETLPFGGDKWGRDVLKKAVKGSEVSIFVGLSSALLATLIGTVLGAFAGYWGGKVNDLLEWFYNIFTSIPYILLILAFAAVATSTGKLGKGIVPIVLILSFLGFGVPVDMVSWGTMLAEAQNELVIGKWWQLAAAGASMAVLVTAFSLLTDSLRDALDPKLK